jgi:hypothetical protein
MSDDFDPSKFRLTPEAAAAIAEAQAIPQRKVSATGRKPKPTWDKVPPGWYERISAADRTGDTWQVAMHLLRRHYKNYRRGPFLLPNGALEAEGVSRWAKKRALLKLVHLGLIRVDWWDKKSPQITILDPVGDTGD